LFSPGFFLIVSVVSMRYEDFVIRFGPGSGGSFAVEVDSPAGEGQGSFRIPESLQARDRDLTPPGAGELREAGPRRRKAEPSERDAGVELFRALFQGQVSKLFQRSLGRLAGKGGGLRVLIELDPQQKELAPIQELPWERLCDPDARDFLALSRKTPIARTLRVLQERRPAIPQAAPLRILAAAASPSCCPPLDLERELHNLENGWKEIVILRNTDWETLRGAFNESSFDVLHFMGHGGFNPATGEGTLILEGKDGAADPVGGSVLAQELKDFSGLRLVVLNACHTARSVGDAGPNPFAGAATALMMAGVPAVIAMSRPISDSAAVAFSRSLYESLAAGKPVEAAMAEARLAIGRFGEWGTPILFLRTSREPVLTMLHVSFLAAALVLAAISFSLFLGWSLDFRAFLALSSNNQGLSLLKQGRVEEARKEFDKALKIDSDNAVAHANLSVLEENRGNHKEALEHARAAVEAEPAEAIHHYNLGTLLARRGSQDDALYSLSEAVRLRPEYAEAHNELGNLYLDLDRPADARRELETGLRANPNLAPLHKNLARVDLAEGRIDEAVHGLKSALARYDSEDRQGIAEALYWLAIAHARVGRDEEACRQLEQVRQEAGTGKWVSEAGLLAQQIPCRRVS
jgi:tetratricopeptide (TPR) repeat protein